MSDKRWVVIEVSDGDYDLFPSSIEFYGDWRVVRAERYEDIADVSIAVPFLLIPLPDEVG